MLSSEGVNTGFHIVLHLEYLEVHDLVDELTFGVSLGLRMQLYLVLHILKEHETLEANAWIALPFLAIVHL